MKIGRNDPCHCGSGKKYKKCHEAADAARESAELLAARAKSDAEKEAADSEAADNPETTKLAKKSASRSATHAASRPKERIATAPKPIRRKAV
jgi:hypothetical protein